MVLVECLLHGMELAGRCNPFDCDDVCSMRLHGEHEARPNGMSIHHHGADTAYAVLASHMRSSQIEILAQEVSQQSSRLAGARHALPVDLTLNFDLLCHSSSSRATIDVAAFYSSLKLQFAARSNTRIVSIFVR